MVNTSILQKYGIGGMSAFIRDKKEEKRIREEAAQKAFDIYQKKLVKERLAQGE